MSRAARSLVAAIGVAGVALSSMGCPATQFPDEGPGQPGDFASGIAPAGVVAACRVPFSKRPPVVSPELWEHLRRCGSDTPRRYLRIGYGRVDRDEPEVEQRMGAIMDAITAGASQADGNARMLSLLRTVREQAADDPELASRVERTSSRTFACDYGHLFGTIEKQQRKLTGDLCPVTAFDPERRGEVCLFDVGLQPARWLTSAWSCLAFTDTAGEGKSCFRLCAYDDYCAAQVSCAAADFDLLLCALGVCTPERVAGIF